MPPEEKTTTEEGDSKQAGLPVLRTFKSDSASFVKKEGISMVDVASAEVLAGQAKKGFGSFVSTGAGVSFFSKRNIIIAGAVLILVGAAIGGLAIFGKKEVVSPAVSLPKPFLTFNFEKEATLSSLSSVIKEPVKEDKLLYIAVVKKDLTESGAKKLANTTEFFQNLGIFFPGDVADIFEGSFMLGVYNHPFIVFKIKSYERAFISMMKWEEKMADDLKDIFMINDMPPTTGIFTDKEIRNRDARVLIGSSGASIISYSFINKDYLVVSSIPDTLDEIIRRFSLSQYLNQ